jgi:DNA-binding NarL/FixJ family response regulator
MKKVRILLAHDHAVVREGLRKLLAGRPNWKVVEEASNGREAVEKVKQAKPDVAVLDIGMPDLSGLEATRQILQAIPRTEVLILTLHESEGLLREVVQAGAHGYVLKSDTGRDLVAAVESLVQHKPFFTPRVLQMLPKEWLEEGALKVKRPASASRLTPREREIVQLLAEGKSNKEVAVTLGISIRTAETHRRNIMRKLQFHSVAELVRYAFRNNLAGF